MALPSSFFARDGDAFVATPLTRGPWSNDHQHGGPPSALLAGAAEAFGADAQAFFVARLTVDYLRPIPITRLTVRAALDKPGRTAQRLSLSLESDGVELARASAVRIRRAASPSQHGAVRPPLPPPEGLEPFVFPFFRHEVGYHVGVEGRYLRGAFGDSAVTVWMRQTAPLVEGDAPSGLQRVVLLADAESGVCNPLDVTRFTFVNPDLTVLLDREPQGEWIALDARSSASALGVGLAQSEVHDRHGPVGRSAQTLVISPRSNP